MFKYILSLFLVSSAFAINPTVVNLAAPNAFDINISQRNAINSGYIQTIIPGTPLGLVGFGSDQILHTWLPSEVISNAGLTTLAGYGITDAYTKSLSDALYAPISGPFPWSGVTGAPSFITGNQTITLSGDATGIGTTSISINVGKLNGQLPSYYLNYANLTGTPTLSTVATSGSYTDLTNKPTIPSGTVTSIGMTTPSGFTVTPSTITNSGTFAITTTPGQSANLFMATPNGTTGSLGMRAIVAADLPAIPAAGITGLAAVATTGAYANLSGTPTLGTAAAQNISAFDAAGSASTVSSATVQKSNNLSDLPNAATARTNLGLGTAATTASTAYDASGAASAVLSTSLQKSSNLSDLASIVTARSNLGLGTAATTASTAYDASGAASAVLATSVQKANNLSDLASVSTARTNLGLGTASTQASTAFEVPLTFSSPLSRTGNTISYAGQLIQSVTATTDATGNYTWTYPTAYTTAPRIIVSPQNNSTSLVIITSYQTPTTTSVIVHTSSLGMISLVLTLTQNVAATVSIVATGN